METVKLLMDKIKALLKELKQYTEYSEIDSEAKDKKVSLEKQLKIFEAMYFCTCILRNTLASAIDSLQLIVQLKNSTFPDEWADETIYNSNAELYQNGLVVICIPEDLPKYSRELNLSCKKRWQGYVYSALKKLKAETGTLPHHTNAIVAMEVHSPAGAMESCKWDTSNRTYNLVINALKGLMFPDDNALHLTFTVAGVFDEQRYTKIYIGEFAGHSGLILQKLYEAKPSKS